MNATLAVIIPNYNKEKYIEKCLESVLRQTLQPNQIIIVDDCSSDGSRDIIRTLAKQNQRIVPVFLKVNKGVSNARNVGVEYANTEYITFLDSDDCYYNPKKLENEMMILSDKGDMALAYSKTVKVNESGEVINTGLADWRYQSGAVSKALIANYKGFSTLPRDYTMTRAVFLRYGGYDTNRALYEDFELSLRLACAGVSFWYTGAMGTSYRAVSGGLSDKKKDILKKEFLGLRMQYWKRYPTLIGKMQIVILSFSQFIRRIFEYAARHIGVNVDIK